MTSDIPNYDLKAFKELGQNFLINDKYPKLIVENATLKPTDTVIEIGPGKGALTFLIATHVKKLICIEKDPRMVEYLLYEIQKRGITNIEVINEDILRFNLSHLTKPYKVIGSLPFYISKQIIKLFLQTPINPALMIFVLQKDVAENYCAKIPNATFLSNFVKIYGSCDYLCTIKSGYFRPIPKVDGGVVKIVPHETPQHHKFLSSFLKKLFNKPRKTILNNLKPILLEKSISPELFVKINPSINSYLSKRPQELTFEQLLQLFMMYNKEEIEDNT